MSRRSMYDIRYGNSQPIAGTSTSQTDSRDDPQGNLPPANPGPETRGFVLARRVANQISRIGLRPYNWRPIIPTGHDTAIKAWNSIPNIIYYTNPSSTSQNNASESSLNKLFDKYRDDPQNNPDTIMIEGAMNYFKDVQISIEDIGVLLASELLSCPSLGEITRQGFVAGWSPSAATTASAQKSHLATLLDQLPSAESRAQGGRFRRVYKHTFKLACPPAAKSIPLDMASEYWKILFSAQGVEWVSQGSGTPWLDWWLGFLEDKWKKAVNRDLWDQTLLFALKCIEDESLGWWSEDSAWPGVIDEFVAHVKRKRDVGGGDAADGEDKATMDVD